MVAIVANALAAADRGHILAAMASFANKRGDQWCPSGHPGSNGQLPRWSKLDTLPPKDVIATVAASAPNHCVDGWSYVARALSALLAGDAHAARHLAYYAQLRAGLSILSNLGVGIFNRTNFVVTSAGAIKRLDQPPAGKPKGPGLGTHEIVWEALKGWTSGVSTSRAFLELVKIRGVSLKECLDAIWPGNPASGAASALIEAWGVDLKRGKEEHVFRNISSYSPQAMNPLAAVGAESLAFVAGFWTLFEPTTGSSFDKLDRFMLRSLLLKQHRTLAQNSDYPSGNIRLRYNELPASIRTLVSIDFLVAAQEPRSPELLQRANAKTSPAQAPDMLARAFLLLRTATALTHTSFVEAGIDLQGGEMRPWIDTWAETRGFWPPANPLADAADLWLDVEIALEDFAKSLEPKPASLSQWLANNQKGIPTIHEAERIGVWSLSA